MTQDEKQLRCEGCGIPLQTDQPSELGYIPEQAIPKMPVICQRCYRIKHYNEIATTAPIQDDFLQMLGRIADTKSLVLHIVDIFDFEGSLIGGLQRFAGNNPVLLAVNKIDLLPKVSNWNKIRNWAQKQVKEFGLKVEDIVLVSAAKNIGFDRLLERLDALRGHRDVYVVGATNVGKSTLINRLIRDYSDLQAELTVSQYPGTTLDLVHIPLEDGKEIIDTPGIVYKHRLTELIGRGEVKYVLPTKPVKPIVFQLNEGQTLFFGGLARFDFLKGERQSFTCYTSGAVQIHRTKTERADDLYAGHLGEMLVPPAKENIGVLPVFAKHSFHVKKGQPVDILISGLGWIKVNSDAGAEIAVHAPKGVKLAMRQPLI
jgi:30S ribosome assembly GTPase